MPTCPFQDLLPRGRVHRPRWSPASRPGTAPGRRGGSSAPPALRGWDRTASRKSNQFTQTRRPVHGQDPVPRLDHRPRSAGVSPGITAPTDSVRPRRQGLTPAGSRCLVALRHRDLHPPRRSPELHREGSRGCAGTSSRVTSPQESTSRSPHPHQLGTLWGCPPGPAAPGARGFREAPAPPGWWRPPAPPRSPPPPCRPRTRRPCS
jgi:hypothetical protein